MDEASIQSHLVSQYLASLAMLRTAIEKCPEEFWLSTDFRNRFWHIAYHILFYTHFYLESGESDFKPWSGHQADAQYLGARPGRPEGAANLRAYSREEMLAYLEFCCGEVRAKVAAFPLTMESGFHWLPFNKLEVHLYSIRHIQHHTGQLADRLRIHADLGVAWVVKG